MQKPNNYDETKVGGDYTPIEIGGHHAVIISVKEQQSSTGKDMVVVALDFARNDSQPGYFKKQYEGDDRGDKKWPYQAVQYIVTEGTDGKCSRSFKSFITSFEKSNNVNITWGDNFTAQFKNKKIGVVYGEVEDEYNGEVKTRRRIRWFCEDGKVADQKAPEKKTLSSASTTSTASKAASNDNSFVNVPEGVDEEIPF